MQQHSFTAAATIMCPRMHTKAVLRIGVQYEVQVQSRADANSGYTDVHSKYWWCADDVLQVTNIVEGAKRHKNWLIRLGEDTTQLSLVKGER